MTNLNLNFQQKRTKTAITQRIKKISSDLKSHSITVQVPAASTTTIPPVPQVSTPPLQTNEIQDGTLSEEEVDEETSSDDDNVSKISCNFKRKHSPLKKQRYHDFEKSYLEPTAHPHTPLEFFGTQRVKLNDPIVLPLEDESFKLIFGYPPFDIEIREVQYLNDGKIGIRYFILLPSREDLEPIVGADYVSRWYIKYECLPLKTSIFSFLHHTCTPSEKEKYLDCEISIEKCLKFFSISISPKKKERIDLSGWVESN
ncbi:hypothetical protein ACTFIY_008690 [Dictyostelium cf. discoideum]